MVLFELLLASSSVLESRSTNNILKFLREEYDVFFIHNWIHEYIVTGYRDIVLFSSSIVRYIAYERML